jgi:hypothetical protein
LPFVFSKPKIILIVNCIFFCSILVGSIIPLFTSVGHAYLPDSMLDSTVNANRISSFFNILVSNLLLSAFLLLTVTGSVFLPASMALLVYRGLVWGSYLYYLSIDSFLLSIPTIILEGEAYILACISGMVLFLAWLKPTLLYDNSNRGTALFLSARECLKLYFVIIILLTLSAVVESFTLLVV